MLHITQRQSTTSILLIGALLTAAILPVELLKSDPDLRTVWVSLGACIAFVGLLAAYWRGWDYARYALVAVITLLAVLGGGSSKDVLINVLVVPILALVVTSSPWVIGSAIIIYIADLVRSGDNSGYTNPIRIITFCLLVSGLVLSRLILETALRAARANAERAEQALAERQQQAAVLERQAATLTQQNDQQRELLALVSTLETPTISLAQDVLLIPIVGFLDSRRIQSLTERALSSVYKQRCRLVILDIAGVPTFDTAVAQALITTVQSIRLLGSNVIITGISASGASSLTSLGVAMEGIGIARSPQEALEQHQRLALA
jgi:anti-anti-sigma regulatory factor